MKNLVIITPKVDANDDLLGSFVGWLKEFSKYFDRVEVICLTKGRYNLPANVFVYSLGKERGNTRLARAISFYKLLFRLVPRSEGVFASYSPIYALASWPVAWLFHKKIILWYLHRSVTKHLKIAEKICEKIVTSSRDSLKFKSDKILELGHGIDLDYFRPQEIGETVTLRDGPLRILSVGRFSRIKNHETLIAAAKILKSQNLDFKVKIIGQPIMSSDFPYFEELKALRIKLDLEKEVEFVGMVPHREILPFYQEAQMLVNPLPSGGLDRTVLEGMATGLVVFTSNDVFGKYFGPYAADLIFAYNQPGDLAAKIKTINTWPEEKKKEVKDFLRKAAAQFHDKENLIRNITQLFA